MITNSQWKHLLKDIEKARNKYRVLYVDGYTRYSFTMSYDVDGIILDDHDNTIIDNTHFDNLSIKQIRDRFIIMKTITLNYMNII